MKSISPQGYIYNLEPYADNPFWNESESKTLDESIITKTYNGDINISSVLLRPAAFADLNINGNIEVSDYDTSNNAFSGCECTGTSLIKPKQVYRHDFNILEMDNVGSTVNDFQPTSVIGSSSSSNVGKYCNLTVDLSECDFYSSINISIKVNPINFESNNNVSKITTFYIMYDPKQEKEGLNITDSLINFIEFLINNGSVRNSLSINTDKIVPLKDYAKNKVIKTENPSLATFPFGTIILKPNSTTSISSTYGLFCYTLVIREDLGSSKINNMISTNGNVETLVIGCDKLINLTSASYIGDNVKEIYITDAFLEQYKVASNWVLYADIMKPLSEYGGVIE